MLTGTSGAHSLRTILATLDSKKQALLLGHALTMPVVIQTREYDEFFYQAMGNQITPELIKQYKEELF